ncbi:glycosyltransferase [Rhizobium sp. ZK1]|uniref:glycosyltransferase n=1 Tax=Rhizobium sp. ZK1 TaxID=3389872 RepID=UPI0039F6A271
MKNVAIYIETFLPPSQSFIINQAQSFRNYNATILAGERVSSAHTQQAKVEVQDIRSSPRMRAGELFLKIPRIGIPALFPVTKKADLIHAHFGKNGYVIGPLAQAARLPLITTFHGFDATYTGDPKGPGGFNQVRFFSHGRKQMAGWNGWNIAVSDFIRERLLEIGFPEQRILRHYIGLDLTMFKGSPTKRRKGLVVSVARFIEYKGHRYMIEALSHAAAQGNPIEFVMVGDGPLRGEIEALARKSLPKVTIYENLSQLHIRNLLAEAELYLHGSVTLENGHAEAFGLANLEAQAVGTPVVAFRSGGVGEAVEDGATGFLVAERDTTGMSNAIGRLLSDADMWGAFSARASVMVSEKFDILHQTRLLEDHYDAVLDEFATARRV